MHANKSSSELATINTAPGYNAKYSLTSYNLSTAVDISSSSDTKTITSFIFGNSTLSSIL